MASTKTKTGFAVTCPFCHDEYATLTIDMNDLTSWSCPSCNEEFSPQQARDMARMMAEKWEAVIRWIDLAETAIRGE